MQRKITIGTLAAIAMIAAPVSASVRIDFSDSSGNRTGGNPGFRVSDTDGGISELLEIGSNGADGLSFLRITGSTSSVGGVDVLEFIVAFPNLQIANLGGADGSGIDVYDLQFQGGGDFRANGFAIYNLADTGLTTPLLLANMTLTDDIFRTIGSSGTVETGVGVNLTGVTLPNGGGAFPTLSEFAAAANATPQGGDFVANVSSAGTPLSSRILQGRTVTGSSAGSIFAVPEPGTMVLLAAGALMAIRSRRGR